MSTYVRLQTCSLRYPIICRKGAITSTLALNLLAHCHAILGHSTWQLSHHRKVFMLSSGTLSTQAPALAHAAVTPTLSTFSCEASLHVNTIWCISGTLKSNGAAAWKCLISTLTH